MAASAHTRRITSRCLARCASSASSSSTQFVFASNARIISGVQTRVQTRAHGTDQTGRLNQTQSQSQPRWQSDSTPRSAPREHRAVRGPVTKANGREDIINKEYNHNPKIHQKKLVQKNSLPIRNNNRKNLPITNGDGNHGTAGTTESASELAADANLIGNHLPPDIRTLFSDLRSECLQRLQEFNVVHLLSLAWAFSSAKVLDRGMLDSIGNRLIDCGIIEDKRRGSPNMRNNNIGSGNLDARSNLDDGNSDGNDATDLSATMSHSSNPHSSNIIHHYAQSVQKQSPLPLPIVAESNNWMVFHKPAGWAVNQSDRSTSKSKSWEDAGESYRESYRESRESHSRGNGSESGSYRGETTVHKWLSKTFGRSYPICSDVMSSYGLLHRLDLETTGQIYFSRK
jgi:hypothetical protein